MEYLDKRNSEGLLLTYSAFELAHNIALHSFERTKNTSVYKILKRTFQTDYLEIYFKKLYYEDAMPLAHKMAINNWEIRNKSNHLHKINIKLFTIEKYLEDFLISNEIKFENNIDISVIRKNFLEIIRNVKSILKKKVIKLLKKNKSIENSSESIGVSYCEGINPDKRSDLFWIENSKIKPSDIVLYFDYHTSFNKFEKKEDLFNRIKKYNIKTIRMRDWNDNSKVDFLEELKIKLKNLDVSNSEEIKLKKIASKLIKKFQFWYLFFKKLNIKIILDHCEFGTDNIIKQLALFKLDGCSVGKLRSHVGRRAHSFLGYYPNDIFFVPSKDSADRLMNHTINKFRHVIISGFPYNLFTNNNKIELKKIKKFFSENNKKFIILLVDGAHSQNKTFSANQMLATDSLNNFYIALFDKLSKVDDIGIIIKTKKLSSLQSLKKTYNKALDLKKKGICYIVEDPFQKFPSLYSTIVNLVIATGQSYPGALIDCILRKKRGVFFDISNLKSIEPEWYQWGKKKVIFNDITELLKNVLEYKNDEMGNKNFGNWGNQVDILDSYKDNLGSERIGQYLNILLKGFKNKLSSSEAISSANYEFAKNWGSDKILQ